MNERITITPTSPNGLPQEPFPVQLLIKGYVVPQEFTATIEFTTRLKRDKWDETVVFEIAAEPLGGSGADWQPEIVRERRERTMIVIRSDAGKPTTVRPVRLAPSPVPFNRDELFRRVLAFAAMPAEAPSLEAMGQNFDAVYSKLHERRRERYSDRDLSLFVSESRRAHEDAQLTTDNQRIKEISERTNRSLARIRALRDRAVEKFLV